MKKIIFALPVFILIIITYLFLHNYPTQKIQSNTSNTSIQIINLDKSIERRQRYESMLLKKNTSNSLFKGNVENIRLKATYGKTDISIYLNKDLKQEVDIKSLKENTTYMVFDKINNYYLTYNFNPKTSILHRNVRHMSIGEFGCLMSHLRAIKNISQGDKEYGLIFEDDFILLTPDFEKDLNNLIATAPKDFCIIKLDTKTNLISKIYSIIRFGYSKNFSNILGNNIIGSSAFASGYLITKKCATQITKLVKTIEINGKEGAADLFLYRVLPSKYDFKNIWFTKKAIVGQEGTDSDIWDKKKKI